MPVPTTITDISVNEGSNSPLGTENVGFPGSVDNYFRSIQAIFRQDSMMKSWEVRGDVPTYVSATSFSIPGDKTLYYKVPRKVQARIAGGSVFGEITASSFNGIVTTVTIAPDAGVLEASLYAVLLGVDPQAISLPPAVITDGLGYTPVNKAGDTMGGELLQAAAPSVPNALANKLYVDSKVSKAGDTMGGELLQPTAPTVGNALVNKNYVDNLIATSVTPGVTHFNTRQGAVTLSSTDVNGALGYVPVNPASANLTAHMTGTTGVFSGGLRSLYYVPVLFASTIGGTTTLSIFNGQIQNLGLVANLNITSIDDMVDGAMLMLVFNATTFTITWPATVFWPLGVAPNLAAGPFKVAVVRIFRASGTAYLGEAVAY